MALFGLGRKPTTFGLDIGTSAVKLVELVQSKGGLALKSFAIVPLPRDVIAEGTIREPQVVHRRDQGMRREGRHQRNQRDHLRLRTRGDRQAGAAAQGYPQGARGRDPARGGAPHPVRHRRRLPRLPGGQPVGQRHVGGPGRDQEGQGSRIRGRGRGRRPRCGGGRPGRLRDPEPVRAEQPRATGPTRSPSSTSAPAS